MGVVAPGDVVINVEKLCKVYGARQGSVCALDHVSLTARRGEFISVLGPSGCGKSTLLMILAGLLPASMGDVQVSGQRVSRPLTNVGVVFQSPVLLEWRTALGNIMLQAEARNLPRQAARESANRLLASVGLQGFEDAYPHQLSGGMRQRVSICRALIHEPPLLLMDEPFGALDALTRDQMAADLQALWLQRQPTVLFVTHSISEAVYLSDRVIVMTPRPGRVEHMLEIDLPRPRPLTVRETPAFTAYVREIMALFLARGVLRDA